jgi:hypothetical protein
LEAESEKGYQPKVLAYLNTVLTNIYSHSFVEYFVSYRFLKSLYCNLRTENRVASWTVLEVLDSKIWSSFEYKSCSLFNLDVFRTFVWYQFYCGIKVIKMRSNSAAAIGWRGLFLPVVVWERRIVVLVDYFMCMVVLVLRIVYGQVVLLRTVLNFVAWQLEKASKYSAVVYTHTLVIWITST